MTKIIPLPSEGEGWVRGNNKFFHIFHKLRDELCRNAIILCVYLLHVNMILGYNTGDEFNTGKHYRFRLNLNWYWGVGRPNIIARLFVVEAGVGWYWFFQGPKIPRKNLSLPIRQIERSFRSVGYIYCWQNFLHPKPKQTHYQTPSFTITTAML